MQNNRFVNACFILIIGLLAVIAFRLDTTAPAYAARPVKYEVIAVNDNIATTLQKETQSGWELVAAPFWVETGMATPRGLLIFRNSR
jgi:hypothetical protein